MQWMLLLQRQQQAEAATPSSRRLSARRWSFWMVNEADSAFLKDDKCQMKWLG